MRIGVLALQGCVDPHLDLIRAVGAEPVRVRTVEELARVERIILPGGESSTMLRLLAASKLEPALADFARTKPVWGICAGAILIAQRVVHPEQRSLALIEIEAHRNYYGSQRESFCERIDVPSLKTSLEVDFIRAPKLSPLSPDVEVLGVSHALGEETPVLLRQGAILAASCHVELGSDTTLHRFFAQLEPQESITTKLSPKEALSERPSAH